MSYSFDMGFVPADSLEEALYKAQQYVSSISTEENIKEIVEKEKMFLEGNRYCGIYKNYKNSEENKSEILHLLIQANKFSILQFCNLHFVYFKKTKLLGLVGCNYPKIESFVNNKICFQNSFDQDYERKDWQGVDYFLNIFDKWQEKPEEYFQKTFPEYSQTEFDIDYLRRYAAYQEIFNDLHLEEWLYGATSPDDFEKFSMSLITDQEKDFLIWSLANKYIKEGVLFYE